MKVRKEADEGGGKRRGGGKGVTDMKRFKYIVKLFERKGWREEKNVGTKVEGV